jgi:hypothetical protein
MHYAKKLRAVVVEATAQPTQICIGIDPSLSGHAVAVLCDGEFELAMGWTDKKTLQKRCPDAQTPIW